MKLKAIKLSRSSLTRIIDLPKLEIESKNILKYLVFLGLGILILVLMWRSQSASYLEQCVNDGIPIADCSLFDRILDDFKSVNWFWILLVLFIYMLSNVFRTWRWQQLLDPLGHQPGFLNCMGTLMLGYFANLGVPRSGEFIRAGAISKYEDIPIEQSFATIVIGRIVDVIMLLLIIGLAFLLSWDIFVDYAEQNDIISANTIFIILGVGVVLGIIGLLVLRYIFATPDEGQGKFFVKIKSMMKSFVDGLKSITKVKSKKLFWAYSFGIWICYYLMTYLCFFAFEPTQELTPIAGLIVFVFGTLGIVFPSPGGMGSYHFLVTQALIILGISSIASFSFAMILYFSIQLFGNIVFGLISLVVLPIINK